MNNETKDKEVDKSPEEEGFTNIVERFTGLAKRFKIKNADVVADHCAKGNLEDLEDIEARMREMGVHPSLVRQMVNFWADEINLTIPKKLRQRMEKDAGIKKVESAGDETERIYFVEPDSAIIRLASGNEKATTLTEAKELQRIIKKDLEEARKRLAAEGEGKETAFILGEGGAWTLNPKAKIGFGEFAVFQMYQDSIKKGEPIDPVEELARREESSVRLREAMGIKGKGEDSELSILDKLQNLGMLKKGGEEGGFLAMIEGLTALGLIRKPGEGESSDLKVELGALRNTLVEMKEDRWRDQFSSQQKQIQEITNVLNKSLETITDLQKGRAGQTEMDIIHDIATEGIGFLKTELPGVRRDIKEALGSAALPPAKTADQREDRKQKYKQAISIDREIEELGKRLFFNEG